MRPSPIQPGAIAKTRPRTPEVCINQYLEYLRLAGRSDGTIKAYYWILDACTRRLKAMGQEALPYRITDTGIRMLMKSYRELNTVTLAGYIATVSAYLRFYGNYTVPEMKITWPQNMRINVNWLTAEQAAYLRMLDMPPAEKLAIHLELDLGLRRIEAIRLSLKDLKPTHINIHGKGRGGGKWRTIPYHPDTKRLIANYMPLRQVTIGNHPDPGSLIVHNSGAKGKASGYSEHGTGWDKRFIEPLQVSLSFKVTNHTLRRTFGRTMFHAGVAIETIALIMGHEDTSTTLRYLGLNMDDMGAAMLSMAAYQNGGMEI